jgi:hypothetical protein
MADDPGTGADVVEPTSACPGARRDHGLQVVGRPRPGAGPAAGKDSLQLSIYAMGYEAMTGRLPDAVALLSTAGSSALARGPPADRQGPEAIRTVPAGSAPGLHGQPDRLSCSWCAFREICPSSAVR